MSLFKKPHDFIAIGDIVIDAFIRLKDAHVNCKLNSEDCEICMKFGDKIPFEFDKVIAGVGNAANASVTAARLGLSSALISNVGKDERGKECEEALLSSNVSTDYIVEQKDKKTNFHYVLWYGAERTILVKHESFAYSLPLKMKMGTAPKWIYLSSMGVASADFHDEIAKYLENNPDVKLAFQPGTFQMELGKEKLARIYKRTEVFAVNVEESQRILGVPEEDHDIKSLCERLVALGPKTILLTDGPEGAYLFFKENGAADFKLYSMPLYPDPKPPYDRTGAGDAFSSTFVAALALGKTPLEALTWAPINSMSVVQYIGAQEGLLSREKLEEWLKKAPVDYKPLLA
jgi:sugar/nucleoside kinase (ribokinase family)